MGSVLRRALVFGLVAAASFWVTQPAMWWPGEAPSFAGGPFPRRVLAELAVMWRAVRGGELPLWNPYEHAGISFWYQAASAVFDPLRWLTTGAACLLGGVPWALVLAELTARVAIGGAGLAVFLRERGVPGWTQLWICVVWVQAPRFAGLHEEQALTSAMWVGWWLWSIERALRRPSMARGGCCGAVAALLWNATSPGEAVPWGALGLAYGLARGIALRSTWKADRTSPWRAAGAMLGVTALLCAGRWLAWFLEPSSSDTASSVSLVRGLPSLWGARPMTGGMDLYLGMVGIFGATLALVRRRGDALAFWAIAAGLGFAAQWLPDAEVAAGLALALAAAWGLAELEWTRGNEARMIPVALALGVTSVGVMIATAPGAGRVLLASTSALVLLAAFTTPGWRRLGLAALPVLAAVELFMVARAQARPIASPPARASAKVLKRALVDVAGDDEVYRVADLGWSELRVGPLVGIRDLSGPGAPDFDPRHAKVLEVAQHSAALLRVLNVAVVGFGRPGGAVSFGTEPIRARQGLHRVESPWPLAFWTSEIHIVEDLSRALTELMDFGGGRRAVFEADVVRGTDLRAKGPRDASTREGRVTLVEQRHNRIAFAVDADTPGVLVVAERYAAGWIAEVDGTQVPLLRANAIFRAVAVAPGQHGVVLRYAPAGYRFVWWSWAFTWGGLFAWAAFHVARGRAEDAAGAP